MGYLVTHILSIGVFYEKKRKTKISQRQKKKDEDIFNFKRRNQVVICQYPRLVNTIGSGEQGIIVPCGRCLGCRTMRVSEWSTRLECELDYHKDTSFLTLTYNDDYLPTGGSLRKKDLQDFYKRLRRRISQKIKHYSVGEYGELEGRPHYHCLIFGWYPDDTYLAQAVPRRVSSKFLEDIWPFGILDIGIIEPESIKYVCGYVMKKLYGVKADKAYKSNEHPFAVMSKGIGIEYAFDNKDRIIKNLSVLRKGEDRGLPRYFVKVLGIDNKELVKKAALKAYNIQEYHFSKGLDINELMRRYEDDRKQRILELKARRDLFSRRKTL